MGGGQQRVDWRIKVLREGEAVVRMSALTDVESDAVEMRFPVYVHGMLKMDAYSGAISRDGHIGKFEVSVPTQRRVYALEVEVQAWWPEDVPDRIDIAEGIEAALPAEWTDPTIGDEFWIEEGDGTHGPEDC